MTNESTDETLESVKKLLLTMKTLRGPGGCEWDRQQNPYSLKKYIIEEAYEVINAIDLGNPAEICDELGDLLLQIVFQAQIFQERDIFGMAEVAAAIDTKLRRRHPHIFSSATPEDRELAWERIKQEEINEKGHSLKLENRIPRTLPALKRAEKLAGTLARRQTKPSTNVSTSLRIMETLKLVAQDDVNSKGAEQQIGDILYDLTVLASSLGIDAEDSLRQSVDRRIKNYDEKGDNSIEQPENKRPKQ